MFPEKIKLTREYIDLIIKKRKEHNLTAYELSEKIGKNKSWLPNIENNRTKNISKDDFLALFKDFAAEESMDTEMYIIKYLNPNALVILDDGRSMLCSFLKRLHKLDESSSNAQDKGKDYDPRQKDSVFIELNIYIHKLRDLLYTYLEDDYWDTPDNEYNSDIVDPNRVTPHRVVEDRKEIYSAFLSYPALATKIYGIDFLGGLDVKHEDFEYISEVSDLISEMEWRFELLNQKAALYNYFREPYTNSNLSYKINSCDGSSPTTMADLISSIKNYIELLSVYITNIFACPYHIDVDFHKLYSVADGFCKDIIRVAKLPYCYSLEIPENNWEESKIKDSQLQLNNIIFQIKKEFNEKYHTHDDVDND